MNKKTRNLLCLVAALIVLAVIYLAVTEMNRKAEEAADTSEALYDGDLSTITEVKVEKADEETPLFHARKDGDAWVSLTDSSLEIDSEKVTSELYDLAELSSDQTVAESVEDMSEYGLDEPTATLTITDGAGTHIWYFGDKNSVTSQYYMYQDGETAILAVPLNTYNTIISLDEADLIVETEESESGSGSETEDETEEETES